MCLLPPKIKKYIINLAQKLFNTDNQRLTQKTEDVINNIRFILAGTYFTILFAVLFVAKTFSLLTAIVFIVLLFPFVFWFIGKLLARTKRTLRSQELFVSNVAHELRGSMSVMMLDTERALLLADSNDATHLLDTTKVKSQELIDALKTDLSGLKTMAKIIHNLSNIASFKYRPGELELARLDLSLLLERLCGEAVKRIPEGKNITIEAKGAPSYISGNESALVQMIDNLLNNSIKYSPEGSTIFASVTSTPDKVTMCIKDDGIGISEKDIQKIFDPFYRSDDHHARKEEGSGLGLAIVNEVALAHKAKIAVKSILKKGTEISVNFPAIA